METVIFFAVFLAGALYVVRPFLSSRPLVSAPPGGDDAVERHGPFSDEKAAVVEAIRDLDFELATGKLSEEDHAELRRNYRAKALALFERMDTRIPSASLTPAPPDSQRSFESDSPHSFCTRCGAPTAPKGRFCASCGAALNLASTNAASQQPGGS